MSEIASFEPYSVETRRLFANPVHAGELRRDYTVSAEGEAAESAAGARIKLAVGVSGGVLTECRYRVFGCPHLIAAAEWWCEASEGQAAAALAGFEVAECMQELAVPVEKTSRILLLEDAIGSLARQLQAKMKDQGDR